MRRSKLARLLVSAVVLLGARAASAQDYEEQRYPVAYADRPLTLTGMTLAPDATFDATNLVKDPTAPERAFETNFGVLVGVSFGILDFLEVRASLGTLRFVPKVEYFEPGVGLTLRFLGFDSFQMGIRAQATMLNQSPEEEGARIDGSLPFLIRIGNSARLDLAPGASVTFQEQKATAFGAGLPVSFAFQMVEAVGLGARTSVLVQNFDDPLENLTVPLGFFLNISLGGTRPYFDVDPYFTWTEFSRPGAKLDNDKLNVDKFSAGATLRFYLFL